MNLLQGTEADEEIRGLSREVGGLADRLHPGRPLPPCARSRRPTAASAKAFRHALVAAAAGLLLLEHSLIRISLDPLAGSLCLSHCMCLKTRLR